MPTKKTLRNEPDPRLADMPSQEEVQTAHQIHTLARMLYERLAMTNPWLAAAPPGVQTTGGYPQPGLDPFAGMRQAPWMQGRPEPPGAQPGFEPIAQFPQVPWIRSWPTQPATTFEPAAGFPTSPWAYGWAAPPMWGHPYGYWR